MSEPFFDYIKNNRETLSNALYGEEEAPYLYTHFEYKALPNAQSTSITLADALRQRKSVRNFTTEKLALTTLSSLLKLSISKDKDNKGLKGYSFPSGGGFYPIETYLLVSNVDALENGLYHYSAELHATAQLQKQSFDLSTINKMFNMVFSEIPQVILLMTMVKSRGIKKYGSLSYVISLMEAGFRGQNISLCVNAFGMACCSMGTNNYDVLNSLLGVDGVSEHYISSIALGLPLSES